MGRSRRGPAGPSSSARATFRRRTHLRGDKGTVYIFWSEARPRWPPIRENVYCPGFRRSRSPGDSSSDSRFLRPAVAAAVTVAFSPQCRGLGCIWGSHKGHKGHQGAEAAKRDELLDNGNKGAASDTPSDPSCLRGLCANKSCLHGRTAWPERTLRVRRRRRPRLAHFLSSHPIRNRTGLVAPVPPSHAVPAQLPLHRASRTPPPRACPGRIQNDGWQTLTHPSIRRAKPLRGGFFRSLPCGAARALPWPGHLCSKR